MWSLIDVGGWPCGDGFDGDPVAEGFEPANEVTPVRLGVVVPGELIAAEVVVIAVVGERVPGDDQEGVTHGEPGPGLAVLAEAAQRVSVPGG